MHARIVFDGGSINNPGRGYGSYQLTIGGQPPFITRLEFGAPITNNEAEYLALIHALEGLGATLEGQRIDPKSATVEVLGDSQLVLKQVGGEWKVRTAHLRQLNERARALVERFGAVALTWQPRAASFLVLGH